MEIIKVAPLMANSVANNLRKFHPKILDYSENIAIFVWGYRGSSFKPHPVHGALIVDVEIRYFRG